MFIDHAGHFYFTDEQWLRGVGRACAPIFLFLTGFAPHYKFSFRLLGWALLLTASDWLLKGAPNTLNILWTILLIRLLLATLEKRGKFALDLHEWVIGGIVMVGSILVFQYGSLGLLIALGGYVYKHASYYQMNTPRRFLAIAIAVYGVMVSLLSAFSPLACVATAISLLLMYRLMLWFLGAPTASVSCNARLLPIFTLCARHTAPIYALHLVALEWLTGQPI